MSSTLQIESKNQYHTNCDCAEYKCICSKNISKPFRENFIHKKTTLNSKIKEVCSMLSDIINNNEAKGLLLEVESENILNNLLLIKTSASVNISNYLERICYFLKFTETELVCVVAMIDRITLYAKIPLYKNNIHKILLISSYIIYKMLNDSIYPNDYFSAIYGISFNDIVVLEAYCLEKLDYRVHIRVEDFYSYVYSMSFN